MGVFFRLHAKSEALKSSKSKSERDSSPERKSEGKKIRRGREDEERPVAIQIVNLSPPDRACFVKLKIRWHEKNPDEPLSDDIILRFARCASGGPFDEPTAWKALCKFDRRYLTLSALGLKKQLRARTVFPLLGLETREGNECLYMNFSRFNPWTNPIEDMIDPLVYVMSAMNEKDRNTANGIALIANFEGWAIELFSMDFFYLLIMVLQGAVPTKVSHFLIVNPPPVFNRVFNMIKRMMTPNFQKVTHLVPEKKIHHYLKRGYRSFLPHEMAHGTALTKEIARDFFDLRKHLESTSPKHTVPPTSSTHNHPPKPNRMVRKTSSITDTTCSMDDSSHSNGGTSSWVVRSHQYFM